MLSPDMFRYVSGLSALVLGQSFCGIATLVAAFDPDASVSLAESPGAACGAGGTSTRPEVCILSL